MIVFPSDYTKLPSGTTTCTSYQLSSSLASPCSFFSNNFTFSSCLDDSNITIAIYIFNVVNPGYALTTGSFQFYNYDGSGSIIQSNTKGTTVTISPAVMTFANISPGSQIVAASCN